MEMTLGLPEGLTALFAVVSPILVQLLVKSSWTTVTKNWVASAVAALIALGYSIFSGAFAFEAGTHWLEVANVFALAILAVYGTQQAVFQFVFKGTTLQNSLRPVGVHGQKDEAIARIDK